MTTENATPNQTPAPQTDVLHAWITKRKPARHRLGERPNIEVPATRLTGGHRGRPATVRAARLVPPPAPSLLARLIGGAQ